MGSVVAWLRKRRKIGLDKRHFRVWMRASLGPIEKAQDVFRQKMRMCVATSFRVGSWYHFSVGGESCSNEMHERDRRRFVVAGIRTLRDSLGSVVCFDATPYFV